MDLIKIVGRKFVIFSSNADMISSIRCSLGSSGMITGGKTGLGLLFRVITGNSPVNCTGNFRNLALNRVGGPLDPLKLKCKNKNQFDILKNLNLSRFKESANDYKYLNS